MKRIPGTTAARLTLPLRVWLQRFAFLLLVLASLLLMMFSKAENPLIGRARVVVIDAVAPVMTVLSRPVQTTQDVVAEVRALAALRRDNRLLLAENERLLRWRDAAVRLETENAALRAQLDYVPPGRPRYITARVVADTGGAFARSKLVSVGAAGAGRTVRRGQAAISGDGLVGRVVDVGTRSARLLLLTDINSGVPVLVGADRRRAILSGRNDDRPRLRYLEDGAVVTAGDAVLTSGDGGVFPPGLAVGSVAVVDGPSITVRPSVDFRRLRYVRIIDHGAEGLVPVPGSAVAAAPVPSPAGGEIAAAAAGR